MDAIVRCIREGRATAADAAPTVLVLDDLSVVGGRAVFHKILQEVCEAVSQQRSQAALVTVLALDQPPAHYQAAGAQHITNGFTDPWGWAALTQDCSSDQEHESQQQEQQQQQQQQQQQPHQQQQQQQQEQQQNQPDDLQLLQAMAAQARDGQVADAGTAGISGGHCVVIDSLSTLLMRHSRIEVLAALTALAASPGVSSILAAVHTDLHDQQTLSALEALSAATVRLTPSGSTDRSPASSKGGAATQPLGRMRCSLKRRTGRLRVEWCCYGLAAAADGGSVLEVYALPPEEGKLDAQELVKRALAAGQLPAESASSASSASVRTAQDGAMGAVGREAWASGMAGQQQPGQQSQQESQEELLLRKLNSSMRLGLSEQERAAREQVVLPYEHRGEGRQYNTGDFKDYLPPAAGGHGAGSASQSAAAGAGDWGSSSSGGRLGHILYVRDSEGEHDSDEDPDDDLDI